MKKISKKKNTVQPGPSKFLVGALIFSLMLLAFVLIFRHQMFDSTEDLSSTGMRGAVRQEKNALKNEVKNKIIQKLQTNN